MSTSVNITSGKVEISSEEESSEILTEVSDVIAGLVECSPIELEADDGEDDDGEEEEEGDVDEGSDGFGYGGHDHLQTWGHAVSPRSGHQSCYGAGYGGVTAITGDRCYGRHNRPRPYLAPRRPA